MQLNFNCGESNGLGFEEKGNSIELCFKINSFNPGWKNKLLKCLLVDSLENPGIRHDQKLRKHFDYCWVSGLEYYPMMAVPAYFITSFSSSRFSFTIFQMIPIADLYLVGPCFVTVRTRKIACCLCPSYPSVWMIYSIFEI